MAQRMFQSGQKSDAASTYGLFPCSTTLESHRPLTPDHQLTTDRLRGGSEQETFLSPEWAYVQSPVSCHASSVSSFQPLEPATPPIQSDHVGDTFVDPSWHVHDWLMERKLAERSHESQLQRPEFAGPIATTWPSLLEAERKNALQRSVPAQGTTLPSAAGSYSQTLSTDGCFTPTMFYSCPGYAAMQPQYQECLSDSMAHQLGRFQPSYVSPSWLESHNLAPRSGSNDIEAYDSSQQRHGGIKSEPPNNDIVAPYDATKVEHMPEADLNGFNQRADLVDDGLRYTNASTIRSPLDSVAAQKRRLSRTNRQKRIERYVPGRSFKGRSLIVLSEEVGATKHHDCSYIGSDGHKCGKRFQRVEHLKRHRQTHDGEMFYYCPDPTCKKNDRKFQCRKDNLREHFKTHLTPTDSKRNQRRTFEEFYHFIRTDFPIEEAAKFIEKLESWRHTAGY